MNVFEMEGFLRGKCIPRDLKVNETNAEYLVRKFAEAEAKCAALAAENAGLKYQEPTLTAMMACLEAFYADEDVPERAMMAAYNILRKSISTPDTDAFLAEVWAQGVERYAVQLKSEVELADETGWDGAAKFLISESEKVLAFAAQIRQEAAK